MAKEAWPELTASGCADGTISFIVKGQYRASTMNHGRPVYKKLEKAKGLDVLIYYWDERDGLDVCGWWFGPAVGGDEVWAYHPSRSSMTPPAKGWNVPNDGTVDPTFSIAANSMDKQVSAEAAALQHLEALKAEQEESEKRLKELQSRIAAKQQRIAVLRKKLPDAGKKESEVIKKKKEAKRQQNRQRKMNEEAKKRKEEVAVLATLEAIARMALAPPEDFEAVQEMYDSVKESLLPLTGRRQVTLKGEAKRILERASACAEKARELKTAYEEWQEIQRQLPPPLRLI